MSKTNLSKTGGVDSAANPGQQVGQRALILSTPVQDIPGGEETSMPESPARPVDVQPGILSRKIQLDDLLDLQTAATWLGLSPAVVLEKSKGRSPKIAAYWINRRVVRFHPRAILAKLSRDNGALPEHIAAMFGEGEK